jgi:LacI family transcriptional regulator
MASDARPPPKLSDVAAAAGVSPATVSRHLNGRLALPQATRDRIDAAIGRLGYRPNLLAKRLSTGRSEAIGLVVPDIANPFFAAIARGVGAEARLHGLSLSLTVTDGDPAREIEALRALDANAAEGLILAVARPDEGTLAQLRARPRQVVLLDEDVPGAPGPRVMVENAEGARLATEALIAAGHRDIAMVAGPAAASSMREREAGYAAALAAAGLEARPDWIVPGDYTRAHGRAAGLHLLRAADRPTAIVAMADVIAIGVIEAARDCGLAVPDDLSVTGFDDMEFADMLQPALTTVRQPIAELGQLAVRRLVDLMGGGQPPRVTRLPVELIARASVAAPREGTR